MHHVRRQLYKAVLVSAFVAFVLPELIPDHRPPYRILLAVPFLSMTLMILCHRLLAGFCDSLPRLSTSYRYGLVIDNRYRKRDRRYIGFGDHLGYKFEQTGCRDCHEISSRLRIRCWACNTSQPLATAPQRPQNLFWKILLSFPIWCGTTTAACIFHIVVTSLPVLITLLITLYMSVAFVEDLGDDFHRVGFAVLVFRRCTRLDFLANCLIISLVLSERLWLSMEWLKAMQNLNPFSGCTIPFEDIFLNTFGRLIPGYCTGLRRVNNLPGFLVSWTQMLITEATFWLTIIIAFICIRNILILRKFAI